MISSEIPTYSYFFIKPFYGKVSLLLKSLNPFQLLMEINEVLYSSASWKQTLERKQQK